MLKRTLFAVALVTAIPAAVEESSAKDLSELCQAPGIWIDPASSTELSFEALLADLAGKDVVLLGETHTDPDHHRWQLHMLAALQGRRPDLTVGFEMFPRSAQEALQDWSKGGLSEADFLEASRWREVWGFDSTLYLPLFHFVRHKRLPMIALNVERSLVSRVGDEGWQAVPAEAREGLSDPAPPLEAYRESLAGVYQAKIRLAALREGGEAGDAPALEEILGREKFQRFVEAQLTWDRAMAEAIAKARAAKPETLVVGVLGSGHIEYGHGVPHQLEDLGNDKVAVLLPVEAGAACEAMAPGLADAVFLLPPAEDQAPPAAKPRLGIVIETVPDGVRVLRVTEGSVAEETGLAAGDVVLAAAGVSVKRNEELIEIVQRQAPGTWLPLRVQRDGEERDVVAKFPVRFE